MDNARIRSTAESLVRMGEELLGMMEGKKVKDGIKEDADEKPVESDDKDDKPVAKGKSDMKKRVLMLAFIKKAKGKNKIP